VKFADPYWLFGAAFALVVAALLIAGGLGLVRAKARFGEATRVAALTTFDASRRRTIKGVLLVLAVALSFVALARPQYSRGQRLVPATNLDVVIVLDFSKSMYARDVVPSRIARAKAEVGRLVRELTGARFGAVAFAGEPLGFPLTSDGAAIAQFLRQTEPNEMPVGGTAIARALERAREILLRDPRSKEHRKVFLLVTDGEDLEGDPVAVARAAAEDAITVHVVQIGGRTPERIPDVGPDGTVLGWRTDDQGKPLTTELSAQGEAQLAQIAQVSGGRLVRAEKGSTGIDEMTRYLKTLMTTELSERVETVYDDKFAWPLSAAVLLLVGETMLGDAPLRRPPPPGQDAPARGVAVRRRRGSWAREEEPS
jgi:Ca-activated chloride channel family protein